MEENAPKYLNARVIWLPGLEPSDLLRGVIFHELGIEGPGGDEGRFESAAY
jgi:hypothetical protein